MAFSCDAAGAVGGVRPGVLDDPGGGALEAARAGAATKAGCHHRHSRISRNSARANPLAADAPSALHSPQTYRTPLLPPSTPSPFPAAMAAPHPGPHLPCQASTQHSERGVETWGAVAELSAAHPALSDHRGLVVLDRSRRTRRGPRTASTPCEPLGSWKWKQRPCSGSRTLRLACLRAAGHNFLFL